jgi:hypothetical protein
MGQLGHGGFRQCTYVLTELHSSKPRKFILASQNFTVNVENVELMKMF